MHAARAALAVRSIVLSSMHNYVLAVRTSARAGVTADLACREKWLAKPLLPVEPVKVAWASRLK